MFCTRAEQEGLPKKPRTEKRHQRLIGPAGSPGFPGPPGIREEQAGIWTKFCYFVRLDVKLLCTDVAATGCTLQP